MHLIPDDAQKWEIPRLVDENARLRDDASLAALALAWSGRYCGLSVLPNAHYLIEDTLRDFPLRGFGNINDLIVGNDRHRIALGIEADAFAGYVIDDDCIELFSGELLAGVFEEVFRFRGEAYDDLRLLARGKFFKNVCRGFEFERHRTFAF